MMNYVQLIDEMTKVGVKTEITNDYRLSLTLFFSKAASASNSVRNKRWKSVARTTSSLEAFTRKDTRNELPTGFHFIVASVLN
jgi:hypothetical protein